MKAWRNAAAPTITSLPDAHRRTQQKEFFFSHVRSRNVIENKRGGKDAPNEFMKTKQLADFPDYCMIYKKLAAIFTTSQRALTAN